MRDVLLVDDEPSVRDALAQTLDIAGYTARTVGSFIEAKDHISRDFDGIVVTDIRMPGKDGFALLEFAQGVDEDLPVILLTGEGDIPMAVQGISGGAFDFLEKPCAPQEFLAVVEKGLKTRALVLENRRLKRQLESGDAAARMLVGVSDLARELRRQVRSVSNAAAEVLLHGEPGSGTAKVAEVIHLLSGASMQAFMKTSAAALTPDSLKEQYERAAAGTVFIDEVAALSPVAQYALLQILEDGVAARTIAGTYRDLNDEVANGRFNADLFYRLEVMRVRIPPLRERTEDIPVLFRHYVSIACEQANIPVPSIGQDVIGDLLAQDWPGNARALMNAAMRFALGMSEPSIAPDEGLGLVEQMAQVERSLMAAALQNHRGNATKTARSLKLPRKTFYDKLARHGIRAEDYR